VDFRAPFSDPAAFASAEPFPHAIVDDWFDPVDLDDALVWFPPPSDSRWHWFDAPHEVRKAQYDDEKAYEVPGCGRLLRVLTSAPFVGALSELTGIEALIPDLVGGGLHLTLAGGFLGVHTDSSTDFSNRGLYRRLNVLLFLNEGWKPGDGGELVLERAGTPTGLRVDPLHNRLVIFRTAHDTLHGHPNPWERPVVPRRSLAAYYYTEDPPPDYVGDRTTTFVEGR